MKMTLYVKKSDVLILGAPAADASTVVPDNNQQDTSTEIPLLEEIKIERVGSQRTNHGNEKHVRSASMSVTLDQLPKKDASTSPDHEYPLSDTELEAPKMFGILIFCAFFIILIYFVQGKK
jgi:hypothetical protein